MSTPATLNSMYFKHSKDLLRMICFLCPKSSSLPAPLMLPRPPQNLASCCQWALPLGWHSERGPVRLCRTPGPVTAPPPSLAHSPNSSRHRSSSIQHPPHCCVHPLRRSHMGQFQCPVPRVHVTKWPAGDDSRPPPAPAGFPARCHRVR